MKIFKEEIFFCPACGNENIYPWLQKTRAGVKFNLWRCSICHTGFMNPQSTRDYLASIYSTSGHGLMEPVSLAEVMASETEYPNAIVDSKRLVHKSIKLLPSGLQELKALDIGSGYGFYSKAAMEEGFKVTAVNPATWENDVFKQMNGFYPISQFFEDIDFDNQKYDLIILSQVLEHVENPLQFLIKIYSSLANHGILAIAVPNIDSILVKILKEKENSCLWVPEHLTYFSKNGLFHLLKRARLSVKYHMYVSRIPYFAISNRLNLQGSKRKMINFSVKVLQRLPLTIINSLGFGFYHNLWVERTHDA